VSPIRTIPWVTPSPISNSPSLTPQKPSLRPARAQELAAGPENTAQFRCVACAVPGREVLKAAAIKADIDGDEAIALSLILVLVSLVVMVFRRDRSAAG
jgi:hypothetical protein